MQRDTFGTRRAATTLMVALMLLAAACGSSNDEPRATVRSLRVIATETGSGTYAYRMPARVASGATRFSLVNRGRQPHQSQLFRFKPGATDADLARALASGKPAAALPYGEYVGGTGLVAPRSTSHADAVVDLQP